MLFIHFTYYYLYIFCIFNLPTKYRFQSKSDKIDWCFNCAVISSSVHARFVDVGDDLYAIISVVSSLAFVLYSMWHELWKRKKDDISFSFIPRSLVLSMDFTSPTSLKDESVTIRNSGDYYLPYRNVNFCGLKHRCNAYKRIVSNGHWLVVASISWHISLKWIE